MQQAVFWIAFKGGNNLNSFERLLEHTDTQHIRVLEKQFKSNAKGLIKGNKIAIRQDIPTVEKASVLAEELGHYYTTVGNILDQEDAGNRKQEHKARTWAYNRLIGLSGLVRAYEKGCTTIYEMAEELEVCEDFLRSALDHYHDKYGCCTDYNGYRISFEPSFSITSLEEEAHRTVPPTGHRPDA